MFLKTTEKTNMEKAKHEVRTETFKTRNKVRR